MLPEFDDLRTESTDLTDLRPAEYRADMVLFLERGAKKVLGVIVEVQLGRDEDKSYTWPAYIANLRARHRCPVCLLVITINDAVERWVCFVTDPSSTEHRDDPDSREAVRIVSEIVLADKLLFTAMNEAREP